MANLNLNVLLHNQKYNMSLQQDLENRSGNKCELCGEIHNLSIYEVKPTSTGVVCLSFNSQITIFSTLFAA